jgi:hypothetical protein
MLLRHARQSLLIAGLSYASFANVYRSVAVVANKFLSSPAERDLSAGALAKAEARG